MSGEAKVIKKRGRPKKSIEADTIVIIDSSADNEPDTTITKFRKPRTKKDAVTPDEIESAPKRRAPRKATTKVEADIEPPKSVKATRSAKITKNVVDHQEMVTGASIPNLESSNSRILEQATAFNDIDQTTEIEPRNDTSVQRRQQQKFIDDNSSHPEAYIDTTQQQFQQRRQQLYNDMHVKLSNVTSELRQSSIDRIDLSLLQLSDNVRQSTDSIAKLKAEQTRRIHLISRTTKLDQNLSDFASTMQTTSSDIMRRLHEQRRSKHVQTVIEDAANHLNSFDTTISGLRDEMKSIKLIQQPTTLEQKQHLNTKTQPFAQKTESSTQPISTYEARINAITANLVQTSQEIQTLKASQNMQSTPPPRYQIKPSSTSKPSPPPINHTTTNPNSNKPPSSSSLRPTETPYDTLRKDPNFRQQSRKWQFYIVGIPVLIVTSWLLYRNYQDTLRRRQLRQGAAAGLGSANGKEKGIGVDRSSNVGVNGGV